MGVFFGFGLVWFGLGFFYSFSLFLFGCFCCCSGLWVLFGFVVVLRKLDFFCGGFLLFFCGFF